MEKTILELTKECQSLIDTNFKFYGKKLVLTIKGSCWQVPHYAVWSNGTIDNVLSLLSDLHTTIVKKYPLYANELKNAIDSYSDLAPVALGNINVVLNLISASESNSIGKKIFISHSSNNADIVALFVDHILQLGIGIDAKDVFCTSIEDMKIRNGEDIRNHIHDNIKSADFSYLFLSDEYKRSEICVNEMGAVWAYNSNVRYYTLPNFQFTEIGWLCNPKSAEVLCNSSTLDSIQRELRDFYSLEDKGATWSKQREIFIAQCNQL